MACARARRNTVARMQFEIPRLFSKPDRGGSAMSMLLFPFIFLFGVCERMARGPYSAVRCTSPPLLDLSEDVGISSLASIVGLFAWKQGLESSTDASAGRGPAFHNGLF